MSVDASWQLVSEFRLELLSKYWGLGLRFKDQLTCVPCVSHKAIRSPSHACPDCQAASACDRAAPVSPDCRAAAASDDLLLLLLLLLLAWLIVNSSSSSSIRIGAEQRRGRCIGARRVAAIFSLLHADRERQMDEQHEAPES